MSAKMMEGEDKNVSQLQFLEEQEILQNRKDKTYPRHLELEKLQVQQNYSISHVLMATPVK